MLARRVLALARQGSYKKWCDRYGFETIRRLAEEGFSDEEIAERCGLTFDVFQRWRKKYAKFRDAIEIGRKEADFSVVEALYKKATGYSVKTNKTHKLKRVDYDPDTGKKVREYEELATGMDETFIPGDLSAEKYWLECRRGDRWGGKDIEDETDGGGEFGVLLMPDADLLDEQGDEDEQEG